MQDSLNLIIKEKIINYMKRVQANHVVSILKEDFYNLYNTKMTKFT